MSGEPTYIEVGTTDPVKAMAFYRELFGWVLTDMPGGGSTTTSTLGIGFHGGDPSMLHEVFYAVDDLEAAMASVRRLGGSLIGEIHDSPGFGRWTECSDDQGARFGIVVRVAAPPAPPPAQVWPTVFAGDAPALMAFLVEAFGFIETERRGEHPVVEHAELAWPEGGGVMLASIRPGGAIAHTPGSFQGYVVTAHPDAVRERALAHGARVHLEPHETDYGSRSFGVFDPEGNLWSFGTYPGAPVPG